MSGKRIVIFTTAYLPFIGGAEIAVKELTERLLDFEFVVITPRLKPSLPAEELIGRTKVIRVGRGNWFDKLLFWYNGEKVARKQSSFDLIWAVMASYGGLAALRYKKKNPTIPFFLNLQEGDSVYHIYSRALWVWPWFKQVFKRADYIQTLSNYLADWAKKMGACCPVTVVPNGVALTESAGIKKTAKEKIILSVSRLVKKNGLEDLVKAMTFLPNEYVLWIVGDGVLRPKLEALIKKKHLETRVVLKGEVVNEKLPELYGQASVFVRPSLSEGLGISFLEAMQLGVPVIATRVGGIPDFLQAGVTGWYCRVRDPSSIATQITYVLAEKNALEVERVVQTAKNLISQKYSWEVVTNQMKKIFNLLCES